MFPSGIPSISSPSSSKSSLSSDSSASSTVWVLSSSALSAGSAVFAAVCSSSFSPSPVCPITSLAFSGSRYIFFSISGVNPDIFVQSIPLPIIMSNDLCMQSLHTFSPPGSVIIFPAWFSVRLHMQQTFSYPLFLLSSNVFLLIFLSLQISRIFAATTYALFSAKCAQNPRNLFSF